MEHFDEFVDEHFSDKVEKKNPYKAMLRTLFGNLSALKDFSMHSDSFSENPEDKRKSFLAEEQRKIIKEVADVYQFPVGLLDEFVDNFDMSTYQLIEKTEGDGFEECDAITSKPEHSREDRKSVLNYLNSLSKGEKFVKPVSRLSV